MRERARQRWIAAGGVATIAAVVAGCACLGIAAALYPGGTAFDADARGFRLWSNFWSDLMNPVSVGGEPNPVGSLAARAGALAFAVGLVAFWWTAPAAFRQRRRLRKTARILGTLSGASLIGVPPGLLDIPHHIAIFLAIALGAGASVAVLAGFVRAPAIPWWIVALGLASIVVSVSGFGFYARDLAEGEASRATPAVQKLATLFLVAWLLSAAGRLLRQSRARLRHPP